MVCRSIYDQKQNKKKIETDEKENFYCCKKNVGITRKCFPNDTLF